MEWTVADMGMFVALRKESEDQEQVTYRYSPDRSYSGLIKFDKARRSIEVLNPPEEDILGNSHKGAMHAIAEALREGRGFPDHLTHSA